MRRTAATMHGWRYALVLVVVGAIAVAMQYRMVQLQLDSWGWLQERAERQSQDTRALQGTRGDIYDRNNEVLAMSNPVYQLVMEQPQSLAASPGLAKLKAELVAAGGSDAKFDQLMQHHQDSRRMHVVLNRKLPLGASNKIRGWINSCQLAGIRLVAKQKRYYPLAEAGGHVVGFVNAGDKGRQGLELAYQHSLQSQPGEVRSVHVQDHAKKCEYRTRDIHVLAVKSPENGASLHTSLDARLQSSVYEQISSTAKRYNAEGGSAAVVNAHTGEILALVNYPSFNPNNIQTLTTNYALRGLFEPGSVIKPFIVGNALDQGLLTPESQIDLGNGRLQIGRRWWRGDMKGEFSVREILARSSQIGTIKIGMQADPESSLDFLGRVGLLRPVSIGMGRESAGVAPSLKQLGHPVNLAALSYGYGISINLLQLAQAYAVIANHGRLAPLTMELARGVETPAEQVIDPQLADTIMLLLRDVVEHPQGTGKRARLPGYLIGGKTGTVRDYVPGKGYVGNRYNAIFAGILQGNSDWVVVVMLRGLGAEDYYASRIAAPLFKEIVQNITQLYSVAPTNISGYQAVVDMPEESIEGGVQ